MFTLLIISFINKKEKRNQSKVKQKILNVKTKKKSSHPQ